MLSKIKREIKSPFSSNNSNLLFYKNENIQENDDDKSFSNQIYSNLNSSSHFIKTTYSTMPKSKYLKKQIKIPLGLNFSPLSNYVAPSSIPVISHVESYELPQCQNQKCQAYLNPFVKFINGNKQWKCNMCKYINKTLDYYYYSMDDDYNNKIEKNKKPELNYGTYEFITHKNYWKNGKKTNFASYYFLIDISENSVSSGFSYCVLETIKDCINNNYFYNYENFEIKICIITYEERINFYPININKNNDQNINMLSINEISDNLFLPTNKDFLLVDLKKYKNKFIQIIESIQNNISSESYKAPKDAIRFFDTIKICDLINGKNGGKILIFSGSNISKLDIMNSSNFDGNINDPKDIKYKLTDGGKIGKLGICISLNGLSVNIFQSCKTYTNVKTQNQLVLNTNGNYFFYRNFSTELHFKNIFNQIHKILLNQNIFDGGLRIKFSHKFGIKDYISPILLYDKEIIFLPNLDSDQNYSFLLEMNYQNDYESSENYIIDDEFTYIQASLYYNRGDGKKIIRVYNLCLSVSSNAKDIYDSINPEILGAMITQKLIMDIYKNKNLITSVNNFEENIYQIFNCYFNNLNMIKKEMSEEMKIFCLYVLGILKNYLFNKNDKGINNDIDLTNFYYTRMLRIKLEEILCFIYPRIYSLDEILNSEQKFDNEFPNIINNNKESLNNNGNIFLIDNGFNLILYFRKDIDKNIIFNMFYTNNINEINFEEINEGNLFDNNENKNELQRKIIEIIDNIRNYKSVFQNLKIIFEGINDQNGKIINENLIEDNYNREYSISFNDFFNKIIFG